MAGIYSNDSDLKPGSAPVIDPSSPNADDNINPETRTRVNGETGVIPPVDPTISLGSPQVLLLRVLNGRLRSSVKE